MRAGGSAFSNNIFVKSFRNQPRSSFNSRQSSCDPSTPTASTPASGSVTPCATSRRQSERHSPQPSPSVVVSPPSPPSEDTPTSKSHLKCQDTKGKTDCESKDPHQPALTNHGDPRHQKSHSQPVKVTNHGGSHQKSHVQPSSVTNQRDSQKSHSQPATPVAAKTVDTHSKASHVKRQGSGHYSAKPQVPR